jgi:hypothetical protein
LVGYWQAPGLVSVLELHAIAPQVRSEVEQVDAQQEPPRHWPLWQDSSVVHEVPGPREPSGKQSCEFSKSQK